MVCKTWFEVWNVRYHSSDVLLVSFNVEDDRMPNLRTEVASNLDCDQNLWPAETREKSCRVTNCKKARARTQWLGELGKIQCGKFRRKFLQILQLPLVLQLQLLPSKICCPESDTAAAAALHAQLQLQLPGLPAEQQQSEQTLLPQRIVQVQWPFYYLPHCDESGGCSRHCPLVMS